MKETDFQTIVDGLSAMTCVVSVEKHPESKRGKFLVVTGNKAYIESIEKPVSGTVMLKNSFIPNTEYSNYVEEDLNFETFCYRAAVEKKCLHSYAHPERMDAWFNMFFIPLDADTDELCYCLYMMEISQEADVEKMSDLSSETAAAVLDTCIRLRGTNDFNATMKEVVSGIRKLCDAEYCGILTMDEYKRSCQVLAESISEDSNLSPMETYLDDDFYELADSWNTTIAGSSSLIAKNDSDMEVVKVRNPVWYKSLKNARVRNIALFPLKSRNQLLGYMWATNYDETRSEKIKETLEITTFILGSELGNHTLLYRLRILSSKDMLTGVMNRNEMNNHVEEMCNGVVSTKMSVGVIFADLNGLKTVNDIEGHGAGDNLLREAAAILRQVFDENTIFRAGGDEFAVILTDVTEEELEKRIERVRKLSGQSRKVCFALGGAVEEDSRNIRMALRHADEKMYEDKRHFYEENPDRINENRASQSANAKVDQKFREASRFQEMNYDQLTDLPSMTHFFKLAEAGRNSMHERGMVSAVLYMNLSGMKYYNKRYGFAEGDILIKEFAGLLAESFGEENCSRFGQDRFAVFTEETGLEERLRWLFRDVKKINNGKTLPVRVGIYLDSMGLVETSLACDRANIASSIKRDDNSSWYSYYDRKLLAKDLNRQYIVNNIDRAISENWIQAFYQPIVRAVNRKVCDEEALARWIEPGKEMLSPADFIPVLEDTRLIYKVDLHVVDLILERLNNQKRKGIQCFPISVNLSRTDFESCDIVEEINNRVEVAGIPKELLNIEITESVIGENADFMKEQIKRFQELGFKVWMDDFGSGYSSLDLLQDMQFDLIKFDMRFMKKFNDNPRSRVLLTELMRMAQSLGTETVCEGVETEEQADFLSEVGCTKLQGYLFSKPLPLEEIQERIKDVRGKLRFEDPDETGYYMTLGAVNMYDLGSISPEDREDSKHYFDTLPMGILEYRDNLLRIVRSNKSYREFLKRYFGMVEGVTDTFGEKKGRMESSLFKAIVQCRQEKGRVFLNERLSDGTRIQVMMKMLSDSPELDVSAYLVAILEITPKREQQLTYAQVAQALSSDYEYLFYVDLETEQFVEYSHDGSGMSLSVERRGNDFFSQSQADADRLIYEGDRSDFKKAFTRENIVKILDEQGVFVLKYRQLKNDIPTYVNMKVVRLEKGGKDVVIGVNNVDAQMRQQETIVQLKEEQTAFSRIYALMGGFIAIYTVDPNSGAYMRYSASEEYSALGLSKVGVDFYADAVREIKNVIFPDDYGYFMSVFSKEQLLKNTEEGKIYKINYKIVLRGEPVPVSLRACIVQEPDGPQLIVGVGRESEVI